MNRLLVLLIPILFLGACSTHKSASRDMGVPVYMEGDKFESDAAGEIMEEDRKVTYSASMTLVVEKTKGIGDKIVQIAKTHGGYLLEGNDYYTRVRVESDSLETALDQMATLGKVTFRNVHGRDVTDFYSDMNLRLDNAQKTRNRYLELLNKADAVSDILLIEKELERISLDIERYKRTLNNLTTNIDYSDVSVSISKKVKPGPIGYVFVGLWKAVKFLFVRN